jgi:proteasome accessory factor C
VSTRASDAFARLSLILNLLHAHPGGLRMDFLADQVGVPQERLRQEILDFYVADTLGVRPDTIVFVSADGREADPTSADVVRVVSDSPSAEIGVELLSPQRWLEVYEKAARVREMLPDDEALDAAVRIIADRILDGVPRRPDSEIGRDLATAVRKRLAVRIEYSRAWKPGVVSPLVKPLRLVETSRGWELDALTMEDQMRTYIVDRMRSVALTDQGFEVPPDSAERLAEHRRLTRVDLVVPHGYLWVVDRYAESSLVTGQDEGDVQVSADFLPPVAERVGLIIVTAENSFVVGPEQYKDAGSRMAEVLLAHHGLD